MELCNQYTTMKFRASAKADCPTRLSHTHREVTDLGENQQRSRRDDRVRQLRDREVQRIVEAAHPLGPRDGVQHRSVLPIAELASDFLERRPVSFATMFAIWPRKDVASRHWKRYR